MDDLASLDRFGRSGRSPASASYERPAARVGLPREPRGASRDALARHSPDALTRFQQLSDTMCMGCYLDRFTKARLLDSLGRHVEAEAALSERPHSLITPLEVQIASELGTVAEKLQHYESAARA